MHSCCIDAGVIPRSSRTQSPVSAPEAVLHRLFPSKQSRSQDELFIQFYDHVL